MKLPVVIVLAMSLLGGPGAEASTAFGLWCNDEGDQLQIDDEGLKTSENVTCTWQAPVDEARVLRAPLHCRTLKYQNGAWVPIHQETYDFIAELASDDRLQVAYTDGRFSHTLRRCED